MATRAVEQRRVTNAAAGADDELPRTTVGRVASAGVLALIAGVELMWICALAFLLYVLLS